MRYYLAMAALIGVSFLTPSIAPADYKYPYHDPYLATATSAILSDDGATPRVDSTIIRVPGLPGRNHLPTLEGRGDLSLALYRQTRPAPLLFSLGDFTFADELEFCIVGQPQRCTGLRAGRRSGSI